MLWRLQLLRNLAFVFLYEISRNIDQFLGIPVCLCDPQHLSVPHQLYELGKQSDVRSGKRVDGLPVVSHRDDLCPAYLRQPFCQVEPLTGDILILVDDDIFILQFSSGIRVPQYLFRPVYHILKIDLSVLNEHGLIFPVHFSRDIKEQPAPDIIRPLLQDIEIFLNIPVCLKPADKCLHKNGKTEDIFVTLQLHKLPVNLFVILLVQFKALFSQQCLQMFQQSSLICVS